MPELVTTQLSSELIIGLVSAVGTETDKVVDLLRERFELAHYRFEHVKISREVIPLVAAVPEHNGHYDRTSHLMNAGNEARQKAGRNDVLALGAAAQIGLMRSDAAEQAAAEDVEPVLEALNKTVFVIDSLKRHEEVETLRHIYPSGFILIGVHAEESLRLAHLTNDLGMTEAQARDLFRRDGEESLVKHGQRVNKTFHLADFFVKVTNNAARLRCDIKRMVELWFGNPHLTPTFDEHAMFLAYAAGLRSADLSRQVGAVVARDSQILSTGANDCPKALGGLYWPERRGDNGCIEDEPEGRDYTREAGDSNRAEQLLMIQRIVDEAVKPEFGLDGETLRKLLDSSSIRDLTEYGRVVHAEMEALLSCARTGASPNGATLYCTTFPCHNCAKHIVASGLVRVVYVEPYPKSMALKFHTDSIRTGDDPVSNKVLFEPFVGIGPRRFFDLFSMQLGSSYKLIRKVDATGKKTDWSIEQAALRIQMQPLSYIELEAIAWNDFEKIVDPPEQNEGKPNDQE